MKNIRVIWPTIRPKVAIENATDWDKKSVGKDAVFVFGTNSKQDTDALFEGRFERAEFYTFPCARPGVCETVTRMIKHELNEFEINDDSIVVLASDDFEAPDHWNAHLIEQFKDFDGALIVEDGYKVDTNIIPLPVVSGAFLKKLNGIIYHPDYYHFFSDQEFFELVTEMKAVKNLRGTGALKFSHKHWSFGGRKKDAFDLRNNIRWREDKATYERRQKLSIEEKLKLPEWFEK